MGMLLMTEDVERRAWKDEELQKQALYLSDACEIYLVVNVLLKALKDHGVKFSDNGRLQRFGYSAFARREFARYVDGPDIKQRDTTTAPPTPPEG